MQHRYRFHEAFDDDGERGKKRGGLKYSDETIEKKLNTRNQMIGQGVQVISTDAADDVDEDGNNNSETFSEYETESESSEDNEAKNGSEVDSEEEEETDWGDINP